MLIKITNFSGMVPQQSLKQLPDNGAGLAKNTRLTGGALSAFRRRSLVKTLPANLLPYKSIYKFGQTRATANITDDSIWFAYTEDTDTVRGQIFKDVTERTFFTNATRAAKTNTELAGTTGNLPNQYLSMGVPAPTATLTPTVATIGTGTAEDRYYVWTYVTSWGEESLPALVNVPGAPIVVNPVGGVVQFPSLPGPTDNTSGITHVRVYRTSTGSTATDYQLVTLTLANGTKTTDAPIGSVNVKDATNSSELAEVCPSLEWDAPPEGLLGLVNLPNGITVGFKDNTVYFSESYRPYTYPEAYTQTVEFPIVGLGVIGATLVVLTRGNPYVMQGVDPSAISVQKLDVQQACVSKRSIVSMGFGVLYASPDGIVLVDGNGARVITKDLFTVREWRATNPETLTCCQYDGQYYGFWATGGFILDPNNGNPIYSTHDLTVSAVFNDTRSDSLYLVESNQIKKWEGDHTSYMPYTWRSKTFEVPHQTNFSVAQVLADTYGGTTLNVYTRATASAEPVLRASITPTSDKPFRLPSGFMSKFWEFELVGTDTVLSIFAANATTELVAV